MRPSRETPTQLPLAGVHPRPPELISRPRDETGLRITFHGWILGQKAQDLTMLSEEEQAAQEKQIQKEQAILRTTIRDEGTALAHIQAATPDDIKQRPLFYRALWELMKERGWNKKAPKKK